MREECYRIGRLRESLRFTQREFAKALSTETREIDERTVRRWSKEGSPNGAGDLAEALGDFLVSPAELAETRGFKNLENSALRYFPPFDPFDQSLLKPKHPFLPHEMGGRETAINRLIQETFEPTVNRTEWECCLERAFSCYSETPLEPFEPTGDIVCKNRRHGISIHLYLQSVVAAQRSNHDFDPFYLTPNLLQLRHTQQEAGLIHIREVILSWLDRNNVPPSEELDNLGTLNGEELKAAIRCTCVHLELSPRTRRLAQKLRALLKEVLERMPKDLAAIEKSIRDGKSRSLIERACKGCGCAPWYTSLRNWRRLEQQKLEADIFLQTTDKKECKSA